MRRLLLAVTLLIAGVSITNATVVLPNSAQVATVLLAAEQSSPTFLVSDHSPKVSAYAYAVFDLESGEILISRNTTDMLPIASVTKLFTAASVLESKNTPVTITAVDVATEGRAGKLQEGQEFSSHELLFPLLLESSNDAATALERTIGPIVCADRVMADASGLSADNTATVRELVKEARRLYTSWPQIFDITTLHQYVGEYTGWINNSPVAGLPNYQGGKHGYTDAAGSTLIAFFAESTLDSRTLGYILLNSNDLRSDTIALRQFVTEEVALQ